MKNILVPVDFSVFSLSAAKAGAFLASRTGAQLHLLHIADIPVGWHNLPAEVQQEYPVLENRMVDAKIKLEKFSQNPSMRDVSLETSVRGGVAFEQINLLAAAHEMDLIVMGVHGAGESQDQFIGSTAQKVVRTAPCPVLTIRKNYNPGHIRKILFASDFNEDLLPALDYVEGLAADVDAGIDLTYVNTPSHFIDDETMMKRMHGFISTSGDVKYNTIIYNSREQEDGILHCIKERKAGMLVMVKHYHTQKAGYLMGITEGLLFHAKVPVLCISL